MIKPYYIVIMLRFFLYIPFLSVVLLCVTACASFPPQERIAQAEEGAQAYGMTRRDFEDTPFTLASWHRVRNASDPIRIYIEGDGYAWASKRMPSADPTPKNPLALKLAARDTYPNVIYIARPCQYVSSDTLCRPTYWTGKRFAPDVIQAYQKALDRIGAKYNIRTFELVGYSGGANIAGLIAAERNDIVNIRTIAGNVDNNFHTSFHGVSPMPQSRNMADYIDVLQTVPQYHFIAENDASVPFDIFENYRSKATQQECIAYEIVPGTTHGQGWTDVWPSLVQHQPGCRPAL